MLLHDVVLWIISLYIEFNCQLRERLILGLIWVRGNLEIPQYLELETCAISLFEEIFIFFHSLEHVKIMQTSMREHIHRDCRWQLSSQFQSRTFVKMIQCRMLTEFALYIHKQAKFFRHALNIHQSRSPLCNIRPMRGHACNVSIMCVCERNA